MFSYILAYRDNSVTKKDYRVGRVFVSRGLETFFIPDNCDNFQILSGHESIDNEGQKIYVINDCVLRLSFRNSSLEVPLKLEETWNGSFLKRVRLTTDSKGFHLIAEIKVDEDIKKLIDARYTPPILVSPEQGKLNALCDHYTNQIDQLVKNNTVDSTEPYCSLSHLQFLLNTIRDDSNQSLTKKHRWLGYVQAILITQYHTTTVDEERNFTRDIFNGS